MPLPCLVTLPQPAPTSDLAVAETILHTPGTLPPPPPSQRRLVLRGLLLQHFSQPGGRLRRRLLPRQLLHDLGARWVARLAAPCVNDLKLVLQTQSSDSNSMLGQAAANPMPSTYPQPPKPTLMPLCRCRPDLLAAAQPPFHAAAAEHGLHTRQPDLAHHQGKHNLTTHLLQSICAL